LRVPSVVAKTFPHRTGRVSLQLEPVAAAGLSTLRNQVDRTKTPEGVAVAIDLQSSLIRLGAIDGVYVVLEGIPPGVRFSAGRYNGDDTWSLAPGEFEGLHASLTDARMDLFVLRVRVLTPDPCGYEYASTSGTFDIVVTLGTIPSAVAAFPQRLPQAEQLDAAIVAPDDPRTAADRRLAAARAEWDAEAAFQLARAREQWSAAAREQLIAQEAALRARHAADMSEAKARWRRRDAYRIAAAKAQWSARSATRQARQSAEEAPCLPAKSLAGCVLKGSWISACIVTAFVIGCVTSFVWKLWN
jgi:hypothetical protein